MNKTAIKETFRPRSNKLSASLGVIVLLFTVGAVAAESTVSFTGELDVYLGHTQPAGSDDTDSTLGIESNGLTTSFLGAHGTRELGNGMTAIGGVEMFLRPDSGEYGRFEGDIFFARATYVGLKGDFGTVKLGRVASLYFLSAISFNPFGDSFSFSPMVLMSFGGGGLYGDTGWSDSIVYSAPTMGGFNTSVAYAFGEDERDTGTNKIAANTFYNTGKFGLTAAIQKISGPQPGAMGLPVDDSQIAALLGVSYEFDMAKVFVQYQMMRDDLAAGDVDRDTFVLSASIPAGSGSVYLAYGYTDVSVTGGDFERDIITLMYNLPLTSQFDLYAGFTSDDPEGVEQTGQTLGAGARFRF